MPNGLSWPQPYAAVESGVAGLESTATEAQDIRVAPDTVNQPPAAALDVPSPAETCNAYLSVQGTTPIIPTFTFTYVHGNSSTNGDYSTFPWTINHTVTPSGNHNYIAWWTTTNNTSAVAGLGISSGLMTPERSQQTQGLIEHHFALRVWTDWASNATVTNLPYWPPTTTQTPFLQSDASRAAWAVWNEETQMFRFVGSPLSDAMWERWNGPIEETYQQQVTRAIWMLWFAVCQAVEAADHQTAEERAETLLAMHLDEEQRRDLRERKCFYLFTRSGKRYRIDRGHSGNVKLIDAKGSILRRYCIHHSEPLPDADHMLSQKLLLEANESEFLRLANAS